jgi:DNA polymerase III alpha subunit (gram-positive type)
MVFDLETGGLKPDYHPITEIAFTVVDAISLEIVDRYSSYIKPYLADELYTPDAMKITGHSKEFLIKNGKDHNVVLDEIIDLFYEHRSGSIKPLLAGHNIINFDIPFLANFFEQHKKKLNKYINSLHYLDTLFFSRLRYCNSPNYQLGTVCQLEDIPLSLEDAHGAIADTDATAELLIVMLKHLRGDHGGDDVNETKKEIINFEF